MRREITDEDAGGSGDDPLARPFAGLAHVEDRGGLAGREALRKAALRKAGQGGVYVKDVIKDMSPLEKVYDPSHPDADKDGYVSLPNVNVATEMVDLISAQRAYEADIAVLSSGSRMHQRALDILQR